MNMNMNMNMKSDGFGDWRIAAASRLAEDVPAAYPGGPSHKAGAAVYLSELAKNENGENIGFTAPSATAMALNSAYKAFDRANSLKGQIKYQDVATPQGSGKSVQHENCTELFDYFEASMEVVVFSFLALESFCNHTISRELKESIDVKRRKKRVVMSPSEAERQLSTEEKLVNVLPKLRSKPTPKGKVVWEAFKVLKNARDACVHLKGGSQYSGGASSEESLFFYFLHFDLVKYPDAALEMILYFHQLEKLPRWLGILSNERKNS